ncbi:MAG TPA: ribose-phosphate pyrophosphokinase [bacterium]|nr:ribose-phosphate pyrophosphokinase [bacterium]HNT66568.1 ribose-phosphate pyrophosphokinase [bacterium]HOX86376.1 ribose-phosphate pyrophosphokinase [bacterium]HPG45795.1 ribose-phosphate pyrophosphokinase [bacterium]HPM97978.1 ribose-phosphate pyrophosphokinase [bacterium]
MKIFSGTANPQLAQKIAAALGSQLGECTIKKFADGELWVKYEENVRGSDVFIIQPTNAPAEHMLELLIMLDAARRASANRITAVIPYYGYARQDRKDQPRVAISAKLFANLIVTAGANRILTMDLHAPQIQGFFDIPLDHLYGASVFIEHVHKLRIPDLIVVSPDIGGIRLARSYARRLGVDLAMLDKRRIKHNECEVTNLVGSVADKNVLIVDDLVDTAGTLINGVQVLKKAGAKGIYVATTHAILSLDAHVRLAQSPIDHMFVTDSVAIPEQKSFPQMQVLTVANLLAEAIIRIHDDRSISDLFPEKGPIL